LAIFGLFFAMLVAMGLLSICGEILMRVRLSRLEVPAEKLLWWRRGGDEVADTYQELFPQSHLPRLRRLVFWLVVALAVALLLAMLGKSR